MAPPDYVQSETVRIMFVHVPAAWMSLFVYALIAGASFVGLVFAHPLADVAAKAAAPYGAMFTALALLTGSLWGKPMWGTYWAWDARLTSELVLLFIYFGYIALWSAIEDPARASRPPPFWRWSAQSIFLSSISRSIGGAGHAAPAGQRHALWRPTMDTAYLWPLGIMALGYTVLFLALG